MARGLRLPTLYPMPRDLEHYWVCYRAAESRPNEEEFIAALQGSLTTLEEGKPYSRSMVEKLVSNLTGKGFLRRVDGRILPPDRIKHHRWDGTWDGSEGGFATYVGKTLLKWGRLFPDGLVLAYDILTVLTSGPKTRDELWQVLTGEARSGDKASTSDARAAKYDGRDRDGPRTVGEVLRLLQHAGWIHQEGRRVSVTEDGRNRRSDLRKRDPYHAIERAFNTVDPVETKIFTDIQKIELIKAFLYRESGGKGKTQLIQRAHELVFDHSKGEYGHWLTSEFEGEITAGREALEKVKKEIGELSPQLARKAKRSRSVERLEAVRDALAAGSFVTASWLLDASGSVLSRQALERERPKGEAYRLVESIRPYTWQDEALAEWIRRRRRGVLRVVTGGGKTVFGFMAIADILDSEPDARVSVLVPTKVLMYQWVTELVRVLRVPPDEIGLRGDGHRDSFSDGRRVVVSIINSAVLDDQLREDVESLPNTTKHLLIADECHRYRGVEFRKAFEARFDYSLGLSATPEDPAMEKEAAAEPDDDPVVSSLGAVFFSYSYAEALADGVVQPFVVEYVGVELAPSERWTYDTHTKQIRSALKKIRQRYGPRLEAMRGPFYARLNALLKADDYPDPAIRKYFRAVRERKAVVYAARNRKWAYLDILGRHTFRKGEGDEDRIIVFHERIDNLQEVIAPMDSRKVYGDRRESDQGAHAPTSEAKPRHQKDPLRREIDKQLEDLFFKPRYRAAFRPVAYYSGREKPFWNAISMDLFRRGKANVMLSVKALVEGIDVPAANVGIVRASSSSVRQRIQTTGRILRRASGKIGAARLYVIYVRATTDERMFHGVDWSEELGSSAIESTYWFPPEDSTSSEGRWEPGELPQPSPDWEDEPIPEFEVAELEPGDPYPGKYAGQEYHVDASGRPFAKSREGRKFIANRAIELAAEALMTIKRGGKFVVTPGGHIIARASGVVTFLGTIEEEIRFTESRPRSDWEASGRPPTFEELFGNG